jgi:hypothetical protein
VNIMELARREDRGAWLPSTVTRAAYNYEAPRRCPPVAGDLETVWRCGFSAGTTLSKAPERAAGGPQAIDALHLNGGGCSR